MSYINGRKVLGGVRTKYLDLDDVYPIGSIYISVNSTSPASLFGGSWELIQSKFLLGTDDLANIGDTGGEATHVLTKQEMPSHNHRVTDFNDQYVGNGTSGSYALNLTGYNNVGSDNYLITTFTGGDQAHNNMPPYIKVAIWKRIADPQEE